MLHCLTKQSPGLFLLLDIEVVLDDHADCDCLDNNDEKEDISDVSLHILLLLLFWHLDLNY